jgi:uncharacterized protein YutE (UPF0331/DUF86 family)
LASPDVMRKRLRLMEGYLKKLHRIQNSVDRDAFLKDTDRQDIVDRNLHLAIESALDIGQHIIAGSGWEPAEEYADVFEILERHGIISKGLLSRVQGMAGFRNLLVHEYAEIDHGQVFDVLKNNLAGLQELARVYEKYIDVNSKPRKAI